MKYSARYIQKNILFGIAALFLFGVTAAAAQQPVRTFTIVPPILQTPLAPGGSSEGTLKVRNETDEPVTFNAFVEDFIVTDTQGTPTILPTGSLSNKYSAASWIGVSPTRFTVPARGVQELTYFMKIPQNARPGGHYAAIVYAPVTEKGVDSTGATVNSQIGTLFSVVVDGPITEKAFVTRFFAPFFSEYGPVAITTQIKNMSDSHIRPTGTVTVKNLFGKKTVQPLMQHNIFPEAARDYVNLVGLNEFMIGPYTATFQGTYGKGNLPLMATLTFWVFPWKIAIVIILFITAGILAYLLLTKKKDGDDHTPKEEKTERKSVEELEAEREASHSA
jgi:hypothetical protein